MNNTRTNLQQEILELTEKYYIQRKQTCSYFGRLAEQMLWQAIRNKKNELQEYNMIEGIGCSECGSETLGDEETICKECKDKSRELAYN